jgi:hypothetical protein
MTRAGLSAVTCVLLFGGAALAQDVGTVASTRGVAEVVRAGAVTPAAVGMGIELGDELRTGDGQMRVLFQDESVIDLAENSHLVVDQQVFAPAENRFTSLMRLVSGKARALVGKYYKTPGASYEVETPTAVAGVRGTTFLVSYSPDTDATEVVGIRGQVAVRSVSERIGETVFVTAHEATTVQRDEAPTPPQHVNDQMFEYQVEGLQVLALGNLSNLAAAHPIGGSASVPAPERAPSAAGMAGQLGRDQLRNSGDVAGQPLTVVGSQRGSLGIPF